VVAAICYLIAHPPQKLSKEDLISSSRGFPFWYAVVGALWLVMSLRSAINVGGNIGNVAVGFAPLIPFGIVMALRIMRKEYHHGLFVGLGLVLAAISSKDVAKSVIRYRDNQARDQQIVSYLRDNFQGRTVLSDGDGYILTRKAGLLHKTELDTVAHFLLAGQDVSQFTAAVVAEQYDVVFVYATEMDYWVDKYPLVFAEFRKHYIELQDPANPLKGRILIAAGVKSSRQATDRR